MAQSFVVHQITKLLIDRARVARRSNVTKNKKKA